MSKNHFCASSQALTKSGHHVEKCDRCLGTAQQWPHDRNHWMRATNRFELYKFYNCPILPSSMRSLEFESNISIQNWDHCRTIVSDQVPTCLPGKVEAARGNAWRCATASLTWFIIRFPIAMDIHWRYSMVFRHSLWTSPHDEHPKIESLIIISLMQRTILD